MQTFTLQYWEDDGWFVGRLKEIPAVMSQGESIDQLQVNIKDAYALLKADAEAGADALAASQELRIAL